MSCPRGALPDIDEDLDPYPEEYTIQASSPATLKLTAPLCFGDVPLSSFASMSVALEVPSLRRERGERETRETGERERRETTGHEPFEKESEREVGTLVAYTANRFPE